MLLSDDMAIEDAVAYVLSQYDMPQVLIDDLAGQAAAWMTHTKMRNYGVREHPEGYNGPCACDECLQEG